MGLRRLVPSLSARPIPERAKMKQATELYLHIPFCVKKCEYCDFYPVRQTRHGRMPTQRHCLEKLRIQCSRMIRRYPPFYWRRYAVCHTGGMDSTFSGQNKRQVLSCRGCRDNNRGKSRYTERGKAVCLPQGRRQQTQHRAASLRLTVN